MAIYSPAQHGVGHSALRHSTSSLVLRAVDKAVKHPPAFRTQFFFLSLERPRQKVTY